MILATLILALSGPLTLDDALSLARNHPRMAAATAGIEQQRHRVDVARAGYLPTANALLGYSRATGNYTPQPGLNLGNAKFEATNANFPFYSAALSISETVWDFGRTRANVEAARAGVDLAAATGEVTLGDLSLSVRAAYFGALGAEALAKAAADSVANRERQLRQAQGLVELGRRPAYDVAKARADLANAQLAQIQARGMVRSARVDLGLAIGASADDVALSEPATEPALPTTIEEALPRLSARPELVQQDARIAAQERLLDAAKSAYWPTIGVQGQFSERGAQLPTVPNWQLGASLNVPLLTGGADAARIEEQRSALTALRRSRDAMVLELGAELARSLVAVSDAGARLTASDEVVLQSREALRLAEGRYEAGAGTMIELSDAQASLSSAEAQSIRARFELHVAKARLWRAMGGR